jgi:hypothetical protein
MTSTTPVGPTPNALPSEIGAGDRVRVAHGVFGRLGRVRSLSPGHILVHYDDGGRELVDLTRRRLWVVR